jgi:tRNA(Arg) A34 adenosine deaminase TadA
MANDGGPFGAVVVCNGELVGRGWNQVTSNLDPTAHAEVVAIRDACRSLQRFDLRGCELYASCEPCPMCLAATYWARLDRVYYACSRKDAAEAGFDDQLIYDQIGLDISQRTLPMVHVGCDAADALFREWTAKPDKVSY